MRKKKEIKQRRRSKTVCLFGRIVINKKMKYSSNFGSCVCIFFPLSIFGTAVEPEKTHCSVCKSTKVEIQKKRTRKKRSCLLLLLSTLLFGVKIFESPDDFNWCGVPLSWRHCFRNREKKMKHSKSFVYFSSLSFNISAWFDCFYLFLVDVVVIILCYSQGHYRAFAILSIYYGSAYVSIVSKSNFAYETKTHTHAQKEQQRKKTNCVYHVRITTTQTGEKKSAVFFSLSNFYIVLPFHSSCAFVSWENRHDLEMW